MQETEEDTNKCEDILCSWIGRTDIGKISILSKVTIQYDSYQNSNDNFHRNRKTTL